MSDKGPSDRLESEWYPNMIHGKYDRMENMTAEHVLYPRLIATGKAKHKSLSQTLIPDKQAFFLMHPKISKTYVSKRAGRLVL